jgi:hypothetical protein
MWQRVFNFLLKFDHFQQKKEYCLKIYLACATSWHFNGH